MLLSRLRAGLCTLRCPSLRRGCALRKGTLHIVTSAFLCAISSTTIFAADDYGTSTVAPVIPPPQPGPPYLQLAPMLGHVSASDARIWIKATGAAKWSVHVSAQADLSESRELEGPATLRTTNGHVQADEIRGPLQAFTTNGGIEARLHKPQPHSPIRLSTSNGGISLTMDFLEDNEVRATTSNGGITLRLPSQAGARVRAQTSHNSIHTDFDVSRDRYGDKDRLDGAIGGGGPVLDLTTSNGSIRLLKL